MQNDGAFKGRGAGGNPDNRYERMHIELEPDGQALSGEASNEPGEVLRRVPTVFYRDASRSILSENDSPDVGFRYSLNPYRGCEHGCIYCYARPSHEYLGFSAGLDFETKIMVKLDAPELLRKTFSAPRWEPAVVALSGNTDCYQPVEKKLQITRRCLEVFLDFRNPVGIITKNALISRDLDLLGEMAKLGVVHVCVSLTTLDTDLARSLEPRAASPALRLETMAALVSTGVPVTALLAPMIPGLNDEELPRLLESAKEAGATNAGYTLVRLASPLDALFDGWLSMHYPERRERILHLIRGCREGALTDSRFGKRMRGQGEYAEQLRRIFSVFSKKLGLDQPSPPFDFSKFRRPGQAVQESLF